MVLDGWKGIFTLKPRFILLRDVWGESQKAPGCFSLSPGRSVNDGAKQEVVRDERTDRRGGAGRNGVSVLYGFDLLTFDLILKFSLSF